MNVTVKGSGVGKSFSLEGMSSPKNVLAKTLLGALVEGCEDGFWLMSSLLGDCP